MFRAWCRQWAACLRAVLIVAVATAFAPAASAKDDYADLKPDEGLLLLAVDNGIGATSVRIEGPKLFDDGLAGKLKEGRNVRLMRFPAGKYRWSRVNLGQSYYYTMDRTWPLEFTIEPGVINYPGELVMYPVSWGVSSFGRFNKASLAMMLLDKELPGIRSRFRWRAESSAPDPFSDFLAREVPADRSTSLIDSADADARKSLGALVDGAVTDAFNEVFSPLLATHARLSPDGSLIAYFRNGQNTRSVMLFDVASGDSLEAPTKGGEANDIEWGGDRLLFVETASGVDRLRFAEGPLAAKSIEHVKYPGVALLDALPEDAGRAIVSRVDLKGETHLYALDKRSRRNDADQFSLRNRLDRDLPPIVSALVDGAGQPRVAVVSSGEDKRSLMVHAGGSWKTLRELSGNERYSPLMLSSDGASLVVLTNEARGQVDLVRVSVDTGEVTETLLSIPGTDVESALLRRRDRVVLGGFVYRGGAPAVEYLDKGNDRLARSIAAHFPRASVTVWDESRDGRRAIVLVSSETERGTYYLYDAAAKKLEKLFDVARPFDKVKPVASTAFTVRTPDGFDVRAFLTVPAQGDKPHPLVVMPHGGPFGVSDTQTFDPMLQLLVHGGFAVLRVNFRGSGGAGRAFVEAGYGQQGRDIETDIERALDHALVNFPLDRERVALLGASYGGYSTLMGLIRAPERYRCGVAISAVTDLVLPFSSSDWNARPDTVAFMKRALGDPATAQDALRDRSPAYLYQRLKQPLLLIHGTNDVRVSFEHAWRLRTLLANAGRPPAWLPLVGANHSLSRPHDRLAMHLASDRFLRECLAAPAAAAAAGGNPTGSGL